MFLAFIAGRPDANHSRFYPFVTVTIGLLVPIICVSGFSKAVTVPSLTPAILDSRLLQSTVAAHCIVQAFVRQVTLLQSLLPVLQSSPSCYLNAITVTAIFSTVGIVAATSCTGLTIHRFGKYSLKLSSTSSRARSNIGKKHKKVM